MCVPSPTSLVWPSHKKIRRSKMNQNLPRIIIEGNAKTTVEQAEALGKELARQLSTSQIRNIFGTVRRIEMNWPEHASAEQARQAHRELLLLKPKMAYQAKRERGRGVKQLTDVLTQAIDLVSNDRTRFRNFVDFFEAILAYHKAHGGK
ncbi:MAG TPA: type III-A CRISPR-associated protein Csm2 [Armatimonadetes bacterium]|nr:type III-A CRISPR-associated protein Csm2 [Armatimonadota bacterium]